MVTYKYNVGHLIICHSNSDAAANSSATANNGDMLYDITVLICYVLYTQAILFD